MSAAAFSAGAATVLAAWQLVPQIAKLRRVRSTAGVSPTWVLLGVVLNGAWLAYRSSQGLWLGVPSPLIAAGLYVVTFRLIKDPATPTRLAVLISVFAGTGLGVMGMVGGWALFGAVLGISGVVQAAPSLWVSFHSPSLSAVAPGLWVIGLAQAVLWGHYGWMAEDAALVMYGGATSATSLAILIRYRLATRGIAPPSGWADDASAPFPPG